MCAPLSSRGGACRNIPQLVARNKASVAMSKDPGVLRYILPAVAVLCGTLVVFANSLGLPRVPSAPGALRYRLYDVVMVPPAQRASAPPVAAMPPTDKVATQAPPLAPVDVSALGSGEQSGYMLEPPQPREHRISERPPRPSVRRQVGRAFRDLLTRIQGNLSVAWSQLTH